MRRPSSLTCSWQEAWLERVSSHVHDVVTALEELGAVDNLREPICHHALIGRVEHLDLAVDVSLTGNVQPSVEVDASLGRESTPVLPDGTR